MLKIVVVGNVGKGYNWWRGLWIIILLQIKDFVQKCNTLFIQTTNYSYISVCAEQYTHPETSLKGVSRGRSGEKARGVDYILAAPVSFKPFLPREAPFQPELQLELCVLR